MKRDQWIWLIVGLVAVWWLWPNISNGITTASSTGAGQQ